MIKQQSQPQSIATSAQIKREKQFPDTGRQLKVANNFQQLFKIQMMKRERKESKHSLINPDKMKKQCLINDQTKRMTNLLLTTSSNVLPISSSLSYKNVKFEAVKQGQGNVNRSKKSKNINNIISNKQQTVSHSEPKLFDSLWRVKQINRIYDKQKVHLLQRHQDKKRRKALSNLPNNILATSISPLSKKQTLWCRPDEESNQDTQKDMEGKISVRYRDIPISEFIYDSGLTKSENSIDRGIQKRIEELCRRKNSSQCSRPFKTEH